MDSYGTEEEQVEALKRWWEENGRSMIISIALALGLGLGWQAWQGNRETEVANASIIYQQMLQVLSEETPANRKRGRELALQLKDAHAGTTYAHFAGLHLARLAVADGETALAEQELRWVLAKSDGEVQQLAQLRLARILAEAGSTEKALEMLTAGQGGSLAASFAIARGDVLMAAGRDDEARLAYDAAAAALGPTQALPASLQEKISYLNPKPAPSAAQPEAG